MIDSFTPRRKDSLKITPMTTADHTPLESLSPLMRSRIDMQNTIRSTQPCVPVEIENHWLYRRTSEDISRIHSLQSKMSNNKAVDTYRIDRALSRHLKRQEQNSEFKRKFACKDDKKAKAKRHSVMSDTRMEQDRLLLRQLMNNPEDRSKIYENSLLQEYYLKDLQKQKTNIQYLKKDFAIVKHRKLTDNTKQKEALHLKHDESQVDHVQLLNYVRHEKQIQQAVKRAKKNITYRKSLNLQRINYLIECMVVKPLAENPVQDPPQLTLPHITLLRKLFFRCSNYEGPETTLYTYITVDRLDVLFDRLKLPIITSQYHRDMFKKLTKYKTDKVLYYYDFIELLTKTAMVLFPKEQKMKALVEFLNKYLMEKKVMYISYVEVLLEHFWKEINSFGEKSKVKFCLETIFNSKTEKLEYGTILTQTYVFEALTNFGLIEAIQREKVLFYFKYVCVRDEGVTLTEFIRSLYLIALSEQFQLYKIKAEQMKKTTQSLIAKNDSAEIVAQLDIFFSEKLKLLSRMVN